MIDLHSSSAPAGRLRVLVLGAGWLGAPLAAAYAAEGHHVTTVRRSPHTPPTGGLAVQADLHALSAPDSPLPDTLRSFDVVIALVAPDRRRGDDHQRTYPSAARAARRIAVHSGARALCWISSTGVYGYSDGREVTEDTPLLASDDAQRALIEAEQIILGTQPGAEAAATTSGTDAGEQAAATSSGTDAAVASVTLETATLEAGVLRVAGLYGPDRDPAGRYRDPVAAAARRDQWVNLAWRDDVIAAVRCWVDRALTARPDPLPRVLNVADGTPLTVLECARLVARADGRAFEFAAAAPAPMPPAASAPAAAAADTTTPATTPPRGAPPRSNQRIRVDALRALGWRPRVPTLLDGLVALGYERLRPESLPYGPQTVGLRRFLQRLAETDAATRAAITAAWTVASASPTFQQAERLLGETIARAGREEERNAVAGPLVQMLRVPGGAADPALLHDEHDPAATDGYDPVIVPALGALCALLVRDLLPTSAWETLTEPVRALLDPSA